MTLRAGCTPSLNLQSSNSFIAYKSIETMSNAAKVYQMAPPISDRTYCVITGTKIIETKLNGTLTPNVAKLNRECRTV